jgi:ubiquinone/menaquinone biosynthesis C-methylase UbiE
MSAEPPLEIPKNFHTLMAVANPEGPVLDLGTGEGPYLPFLSNDTIGIDVDRHRLSKCKLRGFEVIQCDANQRLPFVDSSFGLVFASHILEHLDSPYLALKELARVLRPKGRLIVALPSEISLIRWVYDDYYAGHGGHVYGFSYAGAIAILNRAGFTVRKVSLDLPFGNHRFMLVPGLLANRFPAKIIPLSTAFWLLCDKNSPND